MFPDKSHNQQGVPVNLPSIASTDQSSAPPQVPMQASPAALSAHSKGGGDVAAHYAAQARRVISQYGNDPYKLSVAFSQLKSAYLAEQYHITSNQTGN